MKTAIFLMLVSSGVCSVVMFAWTCFAWRQLIGATDRSVSAVVHTNPMCANLLFGSGDFSGPAPLQWRTARSPSLRETLIAFGLVMVPGVSLVLLAAGILSIALHSIRVWLNPNQASRQFSKV